MSAHPVDSPPYGTPRSAKGPSQILDQKRDQRSFEKYFNSEAIRQSKEDIPTTTGLSLVERMELEEMTHPSDSSRRRPLARLPGYGYD